MTAPDVKLVPGQVRVEAWDLCVDSADRRKQNARTSVFRRALVHDFDDGLTINWDGDYPGGVTINGNTVRVVGKLQITSAAFASPETVTGTGAPGKATVRSGGQVLSAAAAQSVATATMRASLLEKYLGSGPIDVVAALATLVVELDSMKQQLAKVQENWRWCKKCRCLFFAGNPATSPKECPAGGQHTLEGSGNYRLLHA